jgi:mannan endo-1,4-beta-mannosidase
LQDYYHGGKFVFLRWAGFNITGSQSPLPADTMQFYTNSTVIASFDNYIHYLLTHVNPYTGLSYAEDPTIIGYETGNELNAIKWGDKNVPAEWIREICRFIKKLGNFSTFPFFQTCLLIDGKAQRNSASTAHMA